MTSQEPPPEPDDNGPTKGLPSYGSFDPPPPGVTPPPSGGTPPPPYGGNQPPVGGSTPFSAGDAIGYGWKKFRENAGPILLATLVLVVASIALSTIGSIITGEPAGSGFRFDTDGGFNFSLGAMVFQILSTLVGYVVSAAIIRGALDVAEGKQFDLGSAFSNLPYGNVIITSLLISVLEAIGFVLCIIPGILVAFFSIFALYFVIDKNQSPIDAITSSAKLVRAHLGDTLLLIFLSIVVVIAGFLALCVGIFVALPVIILAWSYSFKKFLGEPVAA